jgi:hypothetical protein
MGRACGTCGRGDKCRLKNLKEKYRLKGLGIVGG